MEKIDDVRDGFDPASEVSDWFWDRITVAKISPGAFADWDDDELIQFANEMLDLKTYFSDVPFHPPEDVYVTENSLL